MAFLSFQTPTVLYGELKPLQMESISCVCISVQPDITWSEMNFIQSKTLVSNAACMNIFWPQLQFQICQLSAANVLWVATVQVISR